MHGGSGRDRGSQPEPTVQPYGEVTMRIRTPTFVSLVLCVAATLGSASAAEGYFIQADTVRAYEGNLQGAACVPEGAFVPGEGVVFRVRITDPDTGEYLTRADAEALGLNVSVHVDGQSPIPAVVIPHPPRAAEDTDYWTALWMIPHEYPAGNAPWEVVVRDAHGVESRFTPIGQLIGFGVLQVLPAGE